MLDTRGPQPLFGQRWWYKAADKYAVFTMILDKFNWVKDTETYMKIASGVEPIVDQAFIAAQVQDATFLQGIINDKLYETMGITSGVKIYPYYNVETLWEKSVAACIGWQVVWAGHPVDLDRGMLLAQQVFDDNARAAGQTLEVMRETFTQATINLAAAGAMWSTLWIAGKDTRRSLQKRQATPVNGATCYNVKTMKRLMAYGTKGPDFKPLTNFAVC